MKRTGLNSFVRLEYKNIPDFCGVCKTIGRSVNSCRKTNMAGGIQERINGREGWHKNNKEGTNTNMRVAVDKLKKGTRTQLVRSN